MRLRPSAARLPESLSCATAGDKAKVINEVVNDATHNALEAPKLARKTAVREFISLTSEEAPWYIRKGVLVANYSRFSG